MSSIPEHRTALAAVAGGVALAVAMGIGRFAFTPLLPLMQEDQGLSVTAAGWLASANYIGYLVGALSATAIPARSAILIRVSLIGIAAATAAMGSVQAFPAWIALRACAGVLSAWVLIHVSVWSLHGLSASRGPAWQGVLFSGIGGGIVLAGGACLLLSKLAVRSSVAWMLFGALALFLSLPVWTAFDDGSRTPSVSRHASGPMRWDRETLALVLCYGAYGFGYIIPATFLPSMARQIIHDPLIFGWSWPVFGAAAMASTLVAGALRRRFLNRRLWAFSHLAMGLGVALPAFWTGLPGILLAALLVGGTFVAVTMLAVQEAREHAGAGAGALIAAMTAAFATGQIAGPLVASYVAGSTGTYAGPLILAAGLLAISGIVLLDRRIAV